ncbi:MAG: hypothetical protein EBR52_09320 [Microbacteriaceae bacterium]|nr:hypothetical protein [Microbacteriaceae bacterium]
MKTYHLLHDIGIYKATVVRNFRDNDRGREYDHVRDLLAKRTQRYTLAELRELSGFFWTSHDECVVECGGDDGFSAVQVYVSARKIEAGEAAIQVIEQLEATQEIQQ